MATRLVSSIAALLALSLTVAATGVSSETVTSITGSGIVNGDNHHTGAFKSGRFSLRVIGTTGWIRYSNRRQRIVFASTRIRLFRDETATEPTVALAGTGNLNRARVRFYVRGIDAGGALEDVFYINFRDLKGFWLSEAGGRIWSGNVAIR
jgi:hypothetical protein